MNTKIAFGLLLIALVPCFLSSKFAIVEFVGGPDNIVSEYKYVFTGCRTMPGGAKALYICEDSKLAVYRDCVEDEDNLIEPIKDCSIGASGCACVDQLPVSDGVIHMTSFVYEQGGHCTEQTAVKRAFVQERCIELYEGQYNTLHISEDGVDSRFYEDEECQKPYGSYVPFRMDACVSNSEAKSLATFTYNALDADEPSETDSTTGSAAIMGVPMFFVALILLMI